MQLESHRAQGATVEEMPERRRGFRFRQDRPVKIFEPAVSRYFGGKTQDLSPSGLRLELPLSTPVRAGRIINIHVGNYDPGEEIVSNRDMVPARIIWIDRTEAIRGKLIAGVEFLKRAALAMDAA
jgi:hypothetical protein